MEHFPFPLKEISNQLYQPHTMLSPNHIFTQGRLEGILSKLTQHSINAQSQFQGLVGEHLARDMMNYHLNTMLKRDFPEYEGRFIREKKDYIINKSTNYIAKLQNREQVIILRQEPDSNAHFDFKNISEIDGLYIIKRQRKRKNEKSLIVIEAKTGKNNVPKPSHVQQNIVEPLQELYETTQVGYVVIGFPEELYKNKKKRKFQEINDKMSNVYHELKNHSTPFSCIHFPFRKDSFEKFLKKIQIEQENTITGEAVYDKTTQTILLTDASGNNHHFHVNY